MYRNSLFSSIFRRINYHRSDSLERNGRKVNYFKKFPSYYAMFQIRGKLEGTFFQAFREITHGEFANREGRGRQTCSAALSKGCLQEARESQMQSDKGRFFSDYRMRAPAVSTHLKLPFSRAATQAGPTCSRYSWGRPTTERISIRIKLYNIMHPWPKASALDQSGCLLIHL